MKKISAVFFVFVAVYVRMSYGCKSGESAKWKNGSEKFITTKKYFLPAIQFFIRAGKGILDFFYFPVVYWVGIFEYAFGISFMQGSKIRELCEGI